MPSFSPQTPPRCRHSCLTEVAILPSLRDQLFMSAALHHSALGTQHDDLVGLLNGVEFVCNDNQRRLLSQTLHGCHHVRFILGVECTGGFVRQHDGRILQECACNGHTLSFAAGESMPSLSHRR